MYIIPYPYAAHDNKPFSPQVYIESCRLEYAKRLLETKNIPVPSAEYFNLAKIDQAHQNFPRRPISKVRGSPAKHS